MALGISAVGTGIIVADSFRVRSRESGGCGLMVIGGSRGFRYDGCLNDWPRWVLQTNRGYLRLGYHTFIEPGVIVPSFDVKYIGLRVRGYPWRTSARLGRCRPSNYRIYSLSFALWYPIILFSIYPTIAFIRGPLRRHRRRRKGECIGCGYDLTGNESGVCPECGSKTGQPLICDERIRDGIVD